MILIREDGTQTVVPGSSVSRYGGNIIAGYIPGKCNKCGAVSLMYGDFQRIGEEHGRGMGKEVFYQIDHYAQCHDCGQDLFIESDFSEYPVGRIRYIQSDGYDASPTTIGNLASLASDIERDMTTIEDVFGSMQELEAALESSEEPLPPVMAAMRELRESEDISTLILGNYDEMDMLRDLKHSVAERGYSAYLAEDVKERLEDDPDQAVKMLMHMCSLSIVVDSKPSGHLSEIEWAISNRHVLAVLVPANRGRTSTAMTSRPVEDQANTKIFEYTDDPTECLPDVFDWGTSRLEDKKEKNERFPWK